MVASPPVLTQEQRRLGGLKAAASRKAKADAAAAVAGPAMADLMRMVQDLTRQVSDLKTSAQTRESQLPRNVPMDPFLNPQINADTLMKIRAEPGGGVSGAETTIPHGPWSHPIPEHILAMNPPLREGQAVRIRREARRGLGKDNLSWGELFDKMGEVRCPTGAGGQRQCRGRMAVGEACLLCGNGPVVLKMGFMNYDGEWIYKVRVPGLTSPFGQGLWGWELEAV